MIGTIKRLSVDIRELRAESCTADDSAIELYNITNSDIEQQESSHIQEAWHSFINANVDLSHTKVMQIRQRETLSHQRAITHEVCCCTAECTMTRFFVYKES